MALSRRDQLRRTIHVCTIFARNVSFYRVMFSDLGKPLMDTESQTASFWRQANSNFLDIALLEWCKLFADPRGKHHWKRSVSDPVKFEADLLAHLELDEDDFAKLITKTRHYRDKFVAHLDEENLMLIPFIGKPRKAVAFLHRHLVEKEAQPGDLQGLPSTAEQFRLGMEQCAEEAKAAVQAARSMGLPSVQAGR